MKIRLQLLLPLATAIFVVAAFGLAALAVDGAIRDAVAGDRALANIAADRAVRAVAVVGLLFLLVGLAGSWWLARLVIRPLTRLRREREGEAETESITVAEIDAAARGLTRAIDELRGRRDLDERERAALASLVDAVSEGIVQLDASGRVVRANRASHELLGLPPDAVGRPVASLIRQPELRARLTLAASGSRHDATEVELDDRRVLVSVSPLEAGGAVATFVDLTYLRRLEDVRRDFVANASHELKTPLTSIRGYAETLVDGDVPATEQSQFLGIIARNAERLQRIVDDLLDLSRLESGRWSPELETVDVLEVARTSWGPFAARAADRGVEFSTPSADAPAPPVLADPAALEQVFTNLYDNALRYTERGNVRVSARPDDPPFAAPGVNGGRTRRDVARPAWVRIDVEDTGTGIPRDSLPRIFERFYRVDPARSRAEGGTGLGLSIVKHLIESLGGTVAADSVLGRGTTIRFWLPAV